MVERDVKLIKLLLFFFSKLGLHLPHPVDHKIGKAQWDGDKHVLTVTLHIAKYTIHRI
jgi:hypothetical protein